MVPEEDSQGPLQLLKNRRITIIEMLATPNLAPNYPTALSISLDLYLNLRRKTVTSPPLPALQIRLQLRSAKGADALHWSG